MTATTGFQIPTLVNAGLPLQIGGVKTVLVWIYRAVWVGQVFTLGPAIGESLEDRSRAVQIVGTAVPWAIWGIVLLASLVPTTVSLTALRVGTPTSLVAAGMAWAAGASTTAGIVAVAGALAALAASLSGDLGEAFVQGSAYGHERRLPLRPPGPVLVALPFIWALPVAAIIAGGLGVAAQAWAWAVPVAVLGAVLAVVAVLRLHRLSRRWLVLVPAGVVVHDYTILAETAMFQKSELTTASLALAGSQAANLTGTALGPALEIRLRAMSTVVLAAPPRGQTRALHVQSVLVSPTRPGRALTHLDGLGVPRT